MTEKIERQIKMLRELRQNLRSYGEQHKNDSEYAEKVILCKGRVTELNRNIEFLTTLLLDLQKEGRE